MTKFFLRGAILLFVVTSLLSCDNASKPKTPKAVFIIVDGIPADVIEKLDPPVLKNISKVGGFTRAHVGGGKGTYSETPTISAVGYNSLLTGTWVHKHNVWDNDIAKPNYQYWNIFRIAEQHNPDLKTAIFSTWLDNRTKLVGEGLDSAGNVQLDYHFDSFELDTINYPHDDSAQYIHRIDEAVSSEAGRYIAEHGPDLSWVYLEFTDDMGHRYGDGDKFYNAIKVADQQIGKVWNAIQEREKKFDEDWLIVITTDHGRDTETGKHHGGQSDRERSTWIVTNAKDLNERFKDNPGVVDIMPTIARHLKIEIPEEVEKEMDAVPLTGKIDFADLQAEKKNGKIFLRWKSYTKDKDQKAELFITETNSFKHGTRDEYKKIGDVSIVDEQFSFAAGESKFYKILLSTPDQHLNAWIVLDKP
jgi:predicted AlkP superfamily pyrophosphatase or phosphodiesterase